MRRSARHLTGLSVRGRSLVALPAVLALWAGVAAATGRLVVEDTELPVDAPIWVCAEGAPRPEVLHVDGFEQTPSRLMARPAGGDAPLRIHLALPWPSRGPLDLLSAIDRRPRSRDLPFWGHDGTLGPGTYVLTATGFLPETLLVRTPNAPERRARGLLARARLRAEAGDSAYAAQLVERLLTLEPGSPYAEAAFLALADVWRFTRYRARPEDWLAEWVARHHASCTVGEGYRRWLARAPSPWALGAMARIVARYPETRAAAEARDWLTPP